MAVEYYYSDNYNDYGDDNFVSDLTDLFDTKVDNIFATSNFADHIVANMVFSDSYLC